MLKHLKSREGWAEKNVAQKGFTLIELLVVIAILGILAVVGVLAFSGLTGSAKTATNNTEQSQVQTAVDAYLAKPATPAHAAADLGAPGALNVSKLEAPPAGDGEVKTGSVKCSYTIATDGNVTQGTCP